MTTKAPPEPKDPKKKRTPGSPSRGPRLFGGLTGWLVLFLVGVGVLLLAGNLAGRNYLTIYELQQRYWDASAQNGKGAYRGIFEAKLQGNTLVGYAAGAEGGRGTKFRVRFPVEAIDSDLLRELRTIPQFSYEEGGQALWRGLGYFLPLLLLFGLMYFFIFRQWRAPGGPGSVFSFGRSQARVASQEGERVTFHDVAGVDEAKEEVREVIEFLKNPEKFQRLGGRIPRGILLVGAPGAGKTLLAKAIAGEAGVPFYSICGSDFVEMFVGVGASRVRDLFRQAKESAPCIIFLDEIDAVGRRRGTSWGGGHDEREQTLNAILVEMDGFDTNEQVIVIASTNRPDVLDPALLRPGRFDREIVIDLPDVKGRQEILKVHARNVKLDTGVNLQLIARATPTYSGADLAAIINEAALRATMNGKEAVEMDDLEEARDKIRWGRQKRSRFMDEHDRRVTAYHEAGHALLAHLCPDVEPLHKVTIVPRGMSLGATMMLPENDRYTVTRRNLLGQIKVALAGRIAEEIFCDDISSGAANDIRQATEIARRMVCEYGMSRAVGPIRFSSVEQQLYLGGESPGTREHSENTAAVLDQEMKNLIDKAYADTEKLLRERQDDVRRIAEALIEYEVLTAEQVDIILQGGAPERPTNGQPEPQNVGDGNGAEVTAAP
jgi:cell division protease FtsH